MSIRNEVTIVYFCGASFFNTPLYLKSTLTGILPHKSLTTQLHGGSNESHLQKAKEQSSKLRLVLHHFEFSLCQYVFDSPVSWTFAGKYIKEKIQKKCYRLCFWCKSTWLFQLFHRYFTQNKTWLNIPSNRRQFQNKPDRRGDHYS